MVSIENATAPARGLANVAEGLGRAGNVLAKLQEQRHIRISNIEAINLFNEYDEKVRGLTQGALQKQGSDAFGLYDTHKTALEDLAKEYMDRGSNQRVKDMFTEHAFHAAESSKNQIASHQAAQEKVARDQAIENLVETHVQEIDDNPGNENGLATALALVDSTVDMQYPKEQAQEIKRKAATRLKSEYLLSLSSVDPKKAAEKLKEWQDSGTFDFKTADAIHNQIKQADDEVARDNADRALLSQYGNNDAAKVRFLMTPANRDKLGLSLDQADKLSSMYEQRVSYQKSLERMAKEDRSDRITRDVLAMIESGKIEDATKIYSTSTDLTAGDRSLLHNALQFEIAENQEGLEKEIYAKIVRGEFTKESEVVAATMGLKGQAAKDLRKFFSELKAGDTEAYKQAVSKFKEAKKIAPFKKAFKNVTESDFIILLKNQTKKEGLHGMDIMEAADKLIGTVEVKDWWPDKMKSPLADMAKEGQVGLKQKPKEEGKKPEGGGKSNVATGKIDRLKGYDQADVETMRNALKNAYPGKTISDDDIERGLILNGVQRNAAGPK